MLGGIALGATAWSVSGTGAFAETSWWPYIFMGFGFLYAGLLPAALNVQESDLAPGRFLAVCLLFHVLPVGALLVYAMWSVQSTAYGSLVIWCMATLAAMVLLTLGGFVYRLLHRPPKAS